jgi:Ca2+-binding RTX toxin-like protein
VESAGDHGGDAGSINDAEAITLTFPSGMQYLELGLKNTKADTILVDVELQASELDTAGGTVSGQITSTGTLTASSATLSIELVLEVDGVDQAPIAATVNADGTWSVAYGSVTGTITGATLNSIIDGELFNNGGTDGLVYTTDVDITSFSIAQDTAETYSVGENNDGFQIVYIDTLPNQDGSTSYRYPIDLYAVVSDITGATETITSLILSDMPTTGNPELTVVLADGSFVEVPETSPGSGAYDLTAYTDVLQTDTSSSGTDKIYFTSDNALAADFTPSVTLEVTDDDGITTPNVVTTIQGGSADSTHTGGDGDDFISGGAGNDTLNGGNGNDILSGGEGDDILNGDAGTDTASYASATAGVTVDLSNAASQNTVSAGNDTLSSIENLIGSDFTDTLTGDTGANTIQGGAGNDVISADSGIDIIYGGADDDTLTGGGDADTFVWLSGETGADTITDFSMSDGDVLSLADLLVGEDATNLDSYLQFSTSGSDVLLEIDVDGAGDFAAPEQTILLQGTTLDALAAQASASSSDVTNNLLYSYQLDVDY